MVVVEKETSSAVCYGDCRNSSGTIATDKLFTGQRLDETGLYYYNARYYDATIGRFISADTLVPDPMNPQSINRYSYCRNNPLRFIDPTGHDDGDVFYEMICKDNNIDPKAGLALFMGEDNEVVGNIVISEFIAWVESPERFDYISQNGLQRLSEPILNNLGLDNVLYYHENLNSNPIPLYYVDDEGTINTLLGDIGGISISPIGTFVKQSSLARDTRVIAHEGKHYSEQRQWGMKAWLTVYYGEMMIDWAYYGGDYWTGPYNVNSREVAAREWAGQPSYIYPVPTPWWK